VTIPRPLLLLVISVVRPNRAGAFLPAAARSWARARKGVEGGDVRPGGALAPPPAAPRARRAAQRPPDGGRGAEGGARLGVRVVPPGCGRPSAPRPAAGGRGGPIVHAYKQFEKIGKKPAHIGKRVHVRVLYPSCAFIRYFNHGARRQKSRSRTFSIGNRYERVY